MSAFQTANFYELLANTAGRLEREAPFLLEALGRTPARLVADVACGVGLHALFFAEHGARVEAFDLSPEMVAHARRARPHPRITYQEGDMRRLNGGPYGLVACLGNSLSLLPNRGDVDLFFENAARALLPGGIVVSQTLHYRAPMLCKPRIRMERHPLDDGELAAVKRFLPHDSDTELSIHYLGVTGEGLIEKAETYRLTHWDRDGLEDAAVTAGLHVAGCYGGFDRSPLSPESTDILLIAEKPVSA